MDFLWEGLREAIRLIVAGDREVLHATFVSTLCTLSAIASAALVAIPYGAWLGLHRPRGTGLQVFLLRLGMFVPTVVVGLLLFGVLSRQGPLGGLDLLYTRLAIIGGEFLLAFPIIGSITYAATRELDPVVHETARTLGATRGQAMRAALGEVRISVLTGLLMAFARCFSELGVAITVGGNLELRTRTLASSVVLELSRGRFGKALALGLILLLIACAITILARLLARERER
jgi:tungstate transport system permease protein